ncbi:MAG TPA: DUF1858 domain-containing protein [Caldithrix sp.]|nr:DUF1858 domain-containing protein [Calditrichaceae bacterium]HEM48987.1 DUF1858 domain-containing protein [Caldithrix sp.]HES59686.1 DUF1858 domain-containing protein [Caldithrix sp.]
MNITSTTKIFDLLAEYPALEEKIIHIAPPFKNLKNPILRKTVGKLATLEKAAQIGNLDIGQFVNMLRKEVGQETIETEVEVKVTWQEGEPEWIKSQPAEIIDGTEMLNRGEHPLSKINEIMKSLQPDRFVLLMTNFKPIPMIEAMEKQNYTVFHKTENANSINHLTFIRKN